MAVPLLLAQKYLVTPGLDRINRVVFVSPSEVVLCGNIFRLIADTAELYVVYGHWDYSERSALGASPLLFGGGPGVVRSLLASFAASLLTNRTRSGERRFLTTVAQLSVSVRTFDPQVVFEATPDACADFAKVQPVCSPSGGFVALVDRRRCNSPGQPAGVPTA
jgi:hypothetical protein